MNIENIIFMNGEYKENIIFMKFFFLLFLLLLHNYNITITQLQ